MFSPSVVSWKRLSVAALNFSMKSCVSQVLRRPSRCYGIVMRTGRPKKDRTYDVTLRVRVLSEHDALIRRAAEVAARRKGSGDLSSWVRETLVVAARRELAKEGGGS